MSTCRRSRSSAVEVGGTTIIPTDNVWHYTAPDDWPPTITVRAADGQTASTN